MLDTLSEKQAKLQAKALLRAFESTDLATKTDLTELKAGFAELMTEFAELKTDIQQIKSDQRGVIVVASSMLTLLAALVYLTF